MDRTTTNDSSLQLPTPGDGGQMEVLQMERRQMESSQMERLQMEGRQMEGRQMEGRQMEGRQMQGRRSNTPVVPLPNPGEGGPVAGGGGSQTPVIPLPNPGEGGPVSGETGGSSTPVIPLPNPGEGGPVNGGGSNIPIIPLPNPGEGGPVAGGGTIGLPIWPMTTRVRFLNAAFGYPSFHIQVSTRRVVGWLNYASISPYVLAPIGYQTVTVSGPNGYIFLQKTMPFQPNNPTTIAMVNTSGGLDLLQIPDLCCATGDGFSNFRVSNLAYNSQPLDVLLGDGRVIYADVQYKETTSFKRIRPGEYQFFFAETNLTPMPSWLDIETLDSAFIGIYPVPNTVASLFLNVMGDTTYTVFLLSSGTETNAVQAMVVADR